MVSSLHYVCYETLGQCMVHVQTGSSVMYVLDFNGSPLWKRKRPGGSPYGVGVGSHRYIVHHRAIGLQRIYRIDK